MLSLLFFWIGTTSTHAWLLLLPAPSISTLGVTRRDLTLRWFAAPSASRLTTDPTAFQSQTLLSVEDCLDSFLRNNSSSRLVFVDASWYHNSPTRRNGRVDFEVGPRLPNARYVDMDDVACLPDLFPELNPKGLSHMLPPPELFAKMMDAFGISHQDHIVIYGRRGSIFTPRTWFLFRSMGHEKVSLMQGSLEDWMDAGGMVDTDTTHVPSARDIWTLSAGVSASSYYQAKPPPTTVVDMKDVLQYIDTTDAILLDPRGSSFQSMGHIPGALHIPYSSLVEPDNMLKLKSKEELLQLFQQAGVEDVMTNRTIIATCGSGVSVCHVILALQECGRDFSRTKMYDGSWAEWGADPSTPKILPIKASRERK